MTDFIAKSNARYHLLEGKVNQLSTEYTHVQYLKNIEQQKNTAGVVAVLQAAAGQAGAVNSAQIANDEGDSVEGFVMQVAGKIVKGNFWKTTFKEGDQVQVIGLERDGVFEAVAVTKPDERMIWMQPHCERGTNAKKKSLLRGSLWFVLFGLFAEVILVLIEPSSYETTVVGISLAVIVILFVTVGMSWGDFMGFASEMDAVATALGLPEPENVDLFKTTKLACKNGKADLPLGVYYY